MIMPVIIRPIEQKDNPIVAELIRTVFREFKIDMPGTVYTDPTTDNLFELFETPLSKYWVAEENGVLLGGSGIFPTQNLPDECVELVKLYLSNNARGKGIGKALMQKCIDTAREFGFKHMYLESFPELRTAVGMYMKAGFKYIDKPLGNSGHFACNIWMVMDL
jgi:putative acetyltransferase